MPNLSAKKAIEGEHVALASCHDPRVQAFCTVQPNFKEFLFRFTNAFGVALEPVVFIVRDDLMPRLAEKEALLSFRDLVAICVVPYRKLPVNVSPP